MRLLPTRIPDQTYVARVRHLASWGWTAAEIYKETHSWRLGLPLISAIREDYLSHTDRWDPEVDQVAVERALEGDRKVFENLTVYERREMLTTAGHRALEGKETGYLSHIAELIGVETDVFEVAANHQSRRDRGLIRVAG